MNWSDIRAGVFWVAVVAMMLAVAFGFVTCVERCNAWQAQVEECSGAPDPHACRSAVLAEPPARCSLATTQMTVPRWRVLDAAVGGAE